MGLREIMWSHIRAVGMVYQSCSVFLHKVFFLGPAWSCGQARCHQKFWFNASQCLVLPFCSKLFTSASTESLWYFVLMVSSALHGFCKTISLVMKDCTEFSFNRDNFFLVCHECVSADGYTCKYLVLMVASALHGSCKTISLVMKDCTEFSFNSDNFFLVCHECVSADGYVSACNTLRVHS